MLLKLRSALFWTHLAVGVVVGLFILNMAVSGISIAYSRQITAFAEREQRTVVAPAGTPRLGVEALVAKVQEARPEARLSDVVLYADPTASAMFYVGRENNVLYANPYTGEVLGEGNKTVRSFFQFMTSWHRWLALQGTARPVGEFITGTLSLLYFFLLLSGLCLWLPLRLSRNRVKQGAVPSFKLKGKARDWNWHNVAGLWFAPLLLLVTLTAIMMSHDWADNLLFRLTGNPVPDRSRQGGHMARQNNGTGPAPKIDLEGVDALWIQAEQKVPGWHSLSLRFASSPEAPVSFMIDRGDGGRPDTVAQLAFDRDTGEVTRWQPYESQNAGQKLFSWVRPIHTGEGGGIIGQSIAVLAALGSITLAWTGLSMACRRFFGGRKPATVSLSKPESTPTPSLS